MSAARTMTLEQANAIAQKRIAELESENYKLREAATEAVEHWQTVMDNDYDGVTSGETADITINLKTLLDNKQEGG